MKVVSAVILVAGIWLALVFGAQPEAWSWGPALLVFAAGLLGAAGIRSDSRILLKVAVPLIVAAGWIGFRCFGSPVAEMARADGLLLTTLLGVALLAGRVGSEGPAARIVQGGLAIAILANLAIAAVQIVRPEFTWPYAYRPNAAASGFFGHYNYFANFVVGASLLLAARAILSRDPIGLRLLYGLSFLGVPPLVWLSGSRGGLLALGVGTFLLMLGVALVAWRRKSRWLPGVMIALPLGLVAVGLAGWSLLENVQERRTSTAGLASIADNSSRLEWTELALRVSARHPLLGGGSRAYSWERNREWDIKHFGWPGENEPFVHNEFLQTVTDYGWVGASLVLVVVVMLAWTQFAGLLLGERTDVLSNLNDPVRVGVLASLGAMVVQSNVSFVFHLLPGVVILGLLFGWGARGPERAEASGGVWRRGGMAGGSIALAAMLGWFGWRATRALADVWPVLYSAGPEWLSAPESALRRMEAAKGHWPGFRLAEEAGYLARSVASRPGLDPADMESWRWRAVESLRVAAEAHPYHTGIALNLANTLAELGEDREAALWFRRAIELQGGLESAFRARFCQARHYYDASMKLWNERQPEKALAGLLTAREILDASDADSPSYRSKDDSRPLRQSVESVIAFLEGAGITPAAGFDPFEGGLEPSVLPGS